MDGIEFILTAIVVSLYVLLGSFWAWLIGVAPITLPWFAVVILWPVICAILIVAGIFITMMIAAIFGSIFGKTIIRVRR